MFTLTPLHFLCEATTPLRLEVHNYRAGSNLRGALGNVMQRAYCAGDRNDPAHAAACPVCWLLAANERPGQERRGYALRPPINGDGDSEPGGRFEFGLTLFGETLRFLPYFILAVPEMGRIGVGAGRGKFALKQVWAADPLTGERQCLLAEGESLVHTPTLAITHERIQQAAARLAGQLPASGRLQFNFITPMRLIFDKHILKAPDFAIFFARLLERVDDLEKQFGDREWRRPLEEIRALQGLATQVRLIDSQTRWADVWSGSSRTRNRTPLGGFVGAATYSAPAEVWRTLLPWLVWGQLAQVGKDVVKGNGIYEIQNPKYQDEVGVR
jgi:hypothetical protein